MDGVGIYEWPDGKKYLGNYSKGLKHGHGVYRSNDGKLYIGDW